ncbi:hypothetical protein QE152_g26421 [Popillia japonica]|uniref:Uncharacterized protein n=1 Tax=Popillia japonica TaxID=7064 RepID=A0AAW1JZI7_POPJA
MNAVKSGLSKKLAANVHKVPRTTLVRRLLGRNIGKTGHSPVLSAEEERLTTETLGIVAHWGFPLTKPDIPDVVKKYLDKQGKQVRVFRYNTPGLDFIDSFIKRNNLSIRLASNIKRSRSSVDHEDRLLVRGTGEKTKPKRGKKIVPGALKKRILIFFQ